MWMRWTTTAAAAIMAAPAPAPAQFAGEHMVGPADPGFRLGFAESRALDMQEYVPRGETVQDWTRMVTIQRLPYRPGITPTALLRRWLAGLARACGVVVPPEPVAASFPGHEAADARFDCPRNPNTGKPETVLTRIVVGDRAVHWVQAATRRAPDTDDLAWAGKVIAGTTLCPAGSPDRRCVASEQPPVGAPL